MDRRFSIRDRVILALAALMLLAAPLLGQIPKSRLASVPLCWSVILFHRQCAGCGLTRSFAAIGRGSLAEANAFNPLGPVLFAWAAAIVLIRAGSFAHPSRWWAVLDIAFAAAAAIALIARLVLFYLA